MLNRDNVRTTKTNKQIEKRKSIFNNVFSSSLFVITSSALFFVILIIGFVFVKGIFGASQVCVLLKPYLRR